MNTNEPMSDERLAEIRAAWADGGALNRTGQEVRALLAEVDRLRAALASVTEEHPPTTVPGMPPWCRGCGRRYPCATICAVAADEQEAARFAEFAARDWVVDYQRAKDTPNPSRATPSGVVEPSTGTDTQ